MKDNKREMSIEELEEMLKEADKQRESLAKQLKQKKQDEKERREAELAKKKDSRYKEVKESYTHTCELVKNYIHDYGSIRLEDRDGDSVFAPFWSKMFF